MHVQNELEFSKFVNSKFLFTCHRFVAGPCFILTANSLIDKWIRESVACAVYHLIAACGHILFFVSAYDVFRMVTFKQ